MKSCHYFTQPQIQLVKTAKSRSEKRNVFCPASRGWRSCNICVHRFSTAVTRGRIAELWKLRVLNQSQGLVICCPVVSQASVLPVSHMIPEPGSRETRFFMASKWDSRVDGSYEQASLIKLRHHLPCHSSLFPDLALLRTTDRMLRPPISVLVHFRYAIMKMCWNLEPTKRPTFSKISQMIEKLLGGHFEQGQVS